MLNDNHYIDKFFRESLHNYEVASSDILWERLENGLSNIQPVNSKSENIKKVYIFLSIHFSVIRDLYFML